MNAYKIAAALGVITFFLVWGFIFWSLIQQNWPQVTAFAALVCAINTTWRKK